MPLAVVYRWSVSDRGDEQLAGARESLLVGVLPVFMPEQYFAVSEAARFDIDRTRATRRAHRPERS